MEGKATRQGLSPLSDPNYFLRFPFFTQVCISIAACMLGLQVYILTLDKEGCYVSMPLAFTILFWLLIVYFVILAYGQGIFYLKGETAGQMNKAKLALCTVGLFNAQKLRIRNNNFSVDLICSLWIIFVIVFDIVANCEVRPNEIPTSTSLNCSTCLEISALKHNFCGFSVFYAVSFAVLFKVAAISSEFDYSVQSRELEASEATSGNQTFKTLQNWYRLKERKLIVQFIFILLIWLGALVITMLQVTIVPNNWLIVSGIILVVDGEILLLPATALYLWNANRMSLAIPHSVTFPEALETSPPKITSHFLRLRSPLSFRMLPRKKVVFGLLILLIVPATLNYMMAIKWSFSKGGVLRYFYWVSACVVAFQGCFIVLPMLLVRDREVTFEHILRHGTEDNFGLLLCRQTLTRELNRVIHDMTTAKVSPLPDLPSAGHASPISVAISVPTYVASQPRVETAVVISYRWSDRTTYARDGLARDDDCPPALVLRNGRDPGFDWAVTVTLPQARALAAELAALAEDYVWMDQFCIPQRRGGRAAAAAGPDGGGPDAGYEAAKEAVRRALIPKMTGLYACAGRVLVLNNSGDALLRPRNWYCNRLWCAQEYTLPAALRCRAAVARGEEDRAAVLAERARIRARWFSDDPPRRGGLLSARPWPCESGADIILGWPRAYAAGLRERVRARVRMGGLAAEFVRTARSRYTADSNDVQSALAQVWFGVVLEDQKTREMFVQALVAALMDTDPAAACGVGPGADGTAPPPQLDVVVNENEVGELGVWSGTMVWQRMVSGPPAGMERGGETEVELESDADIEPVPSPVRAQPNLEETTVRPYADETGIQPPQPPQRLTCTGRLVKPEGFEAFFTTLVFEPAGPAAESGRASSCEAEVVGADAPGGGQGAPGTGRLRARLVRMTVRHRPPEAPPPPVLGGAHVGPRRVLLEML